MERGYIAVWRKIQDHPFWKERREFSKLEAWLDLLMEVRHSEEPRTVILGMTAVECGYGQSVRSVNNWAVRWHWTGSKVRRFFKLLEKLGQIRRENAAKTTKLTVCNYALYDPKRLKSGEMMKKPRRDADEMPTTNNNGNKGKNGNNDICERIWKAYPGKSGSKKKGLPYIAKALKAGITEEAIMAGITRYESFIQATRHGGFQQRYKAGDTFFRNDCWQDEWVYDAKAPQKNYRE